MHLIWHWIFKNSLSFAGKSQSGSLPINISRYPPLISFTWNSNSSSSPKPWPLKYFYFNISNGSPCFSASVRIKVTNTCASPTFISIFYFNKEYLYSFLWKIYIQPKIFNKIFSLKNVKPYIEISAIILLSLFLVTIQF